MVWAVTLISGNFLKDSLFKLAVTDNLSTMLQLLGEESAEASWLIQARSRMDPVEPCDEE